MCYWWIQTPIGNPLIVFYVNLKLYFVVIDDDDDIKDPLGLFQVSVYILVNKYGKAPKEK